MIGKTTHNMFDNKRYNRLAIKNNKNYKKAKPYSHIQFKNFLERYIAFKLYKNFPKYGIIVG